MEWKEYAYQNKDGCWIWLGARNVHGYGIYSHKHAHRIIWETLVGPIPEGMILHHTCKVLLCVNPNHLELMTRSDHTPVHCVNGENYHEKGI